MEQLSSLCSLDSSSFGSVYMCLFFFDSASKFFVSLVLDFQVILLTHSDSLLSNYLLSLGFHLIFLTHLNFLSSITCSTICKYCNNSQLCNYLNDIWSESQIFHNYLQSRVPINGVEVQFCVCTKSWISTVLFQFYPKTFNKNATKSSSISSIFSLRKYRLFNSRGNNQRFC